MTAQPVAYSLAKLLLAAIRKTSDAHQREMLLAEMEVALTHLGPGHVDLTREAAMAALGRCGVEPQEVTADAIAADMRPRQNHVVTIVDSGVGPYPFRYQCRCGDRGMWWGERARAVRAGEKHLDAVEMRARVTA